MYFHEYAPRVLVRTAVRTLGLTVSAMLAAAADARAQDYLRWSVEGTNSQQRLGRTLARAGDYNLDGFADFVAQEDGIQGYFPPQVTVFSGLDGTVLLALTGVGGWDLATIEDLDGDGIRELIVGQPGANPWGFNYVETSGGVLVLSGATGATLFVLNGVFYLDQWLGYSVDDAGDFDGDGVHDVLAGAPWSGPTPVNKVGRVKVFSGASGTLLATITGGVTNGQFGISVAALGDLTGDGLSDFIVGSLPNPNASPGNAFVFAGGSGALVYTITGTSIGDHTGEAVGGVGDVDGDATPDFIVGSPQSWGYGPVTPQPSGRAEVFSGATGNSVFTFLGAFPNERFAQSVDGAGDVNGDGIPDIVVGAPLHTILGRAYVYSGLTGGLIFTIDGPWALFNFPTGGPGLSFGQLGDAVVGLGDSNGDGFDDIASGMGTWSIPNPAGAPIMLDSVGRVQVNSFVGIPAGSSPFGTGCPGSGGFTPRILTAGGPPALGNSGFSVALSGALGGTSALLVVGASSSSWLGNPLPLILTPFGIPGCFLRVSADVLFPVVTAGSGPGDGTETVTIPVPTNPLLVGGNVYLQWLVFDPGAASGVAATSEALTLVLQ